MNILTFLKYLRGIFNVNLEEGTVHHAVIQSIYDAFVLVDGDIDLMRLEMCLSTAHGRWLDYWGEWFTVPRKNSETDSHYAKRIIDTVIRPKATIPGIKDYIVDYLNETYNQDYTREDVTIKEPWKELGKYSHNAVLSSNSRFFSQDYWTHAVIDISIPEKLTKDLKELVNEVKAAGVKAMWSFSNEYGIVPMYPVGVDGSDDNSASYHRHIYQMAKDHLKGGCVLSHDGVLSHTAQLCGHRSVWKEFTTSYYWYAKMSEKDTDRSIIITKLDLMGLLDFYEVTYQQRVDRLDTAFKVSHNPDGTLDGEKVLNGVDEYEWVTEMVNLTTDLFNSIKAMNECIKLSKDLRLSDNGLMFEHTATHTQYQLILDELSRFRETNIHYWNSLQPPILNGEPAMYYLKPHLNWLWDTPTMSWDDLMTLWEPADGKDHTAHSIEEFERREGKGYITFADVYQPPIVIAGSPWYWTPQQDNQWLFGSATLNNGELEEIYRTKYSKWPDRIEYEKHIETNPETNLVLSDNGVISSYHKYGEYAQKHHPEMSAVLSGNCQLDGEKMVSGQPVESYIELHDNTEFKGYTYLSGAKSKVTIIKKVREQTPTLGDLIDYEENTDQYDVNYSVREWYQGEIQIGERAMYLIMEKYRQLWDSPVIHNDEIMEYWDESNGRTVDDLSLVIHADSRLYQPPIVMTDSPFYWAATTKYDIPWLFSSATLNKEELTWVYQTKMAELGATIPDKTIVHREVTDHPEKALRLSDNGKLSAIKTYQEVSYSSNPDNCFTLDVNGVISHRRAETRRRVEVIPHPETSLTLSQSGVLSAHQHNLQVTIITHTEDRAILSGNNQLSGNKVLSAAQPERKEEIVLNHDFTNFFYMDGGKTEVIEHFDTIEYPNEPPLKYLSGSKSKKYVTNHIKEQYGWKHRLSGDKPTIVEWVEILQNTPTLQLMMEVDEMNDLVPYPTRSTYQTPIQITPIS